MPKYPITPELMQELPEAIVVLYERLADYLIADICSRFKYNETATATTILHIKQLLKNGYDLENINKYIKKTLKLTDAEFSKAWSTALSENQRYFDTIVTDQTGFDREAFDSTIDAIRAQTHGMLKNITQTMGFAVRVAGRVQMLDLDGMYERVLDDALMKVQNGISYDVAIREATKQLTDSGVQYIEYASGWHNRVDVAARRAVMTGVTQMSRRYSDQSAELLDTPYREVSAHRGARDKDYPNPWSNHKKWQGRVYSIREKDKYPSIYAVCGLEQVDGLCGANCRHTYFPFVEGVTERTYTDEELENLDPPPFDFEGKKYTMYEATQKQRQIETALRKVKREAIAAKARGDDEEYTNLAVRYKRLNDEYHAFSKAAGLREQIERGNITEFGADESKLINKQYNALAKQANGMYNTGSESGNVDAYLRDLPIRQKIKNEYSHEMNTGRQNGHYPGTNEYNMYVQKQQRQGLYGPSVVTVTPDELTELFNQYSGTGILERLRDTPAWDEKETITLSDKAIGYTVNTRTGEKMETSCFTIHYSRKKGWHIVPAYADLKGAKDSYVPTRSG